MAFKRPSLFTCGENVNNVWPEGILWPLKSKAPQCLGIPPMEKEALFFVLKVKLFDSLTQSIILDPGLKQLSSIS